MTTDPREFEHPIDGSQHGHNPVSADMESIIAAALTTHWARTMCSEGDGFYIECRCGEIGHVESDAEDWEPANQWSAAHQARAVLAAISEAGAVEGPWKP